MSRPGAVPLVTRARARLVPLRAGIILGRMTFVPGRAGCPCRDPGKLQRDPGKLGRDPGKSVPSPREPLSESLRGAVRDGGPLLGAVRNEMPIHILHIRGRLVS